MFVLELTVLCLICITERGILFYSSIPAAILYSQKSSTDCKVAGGIRELHAAPIMFCNTAGRTKINIKKWRFGIKFCVQSTVIILIRAYPPYQFQGDLIWCDGTFKSKKILGPQITNSQSVTFAEGPQI
jgi:hypothetical protein